jgi:hypothetical protein
MNRITTTLLYLAFISFFVPAVNCQTSMNEAAVPTVDGKIDESEWKGAKVFTNFYVVSPKSDEKYYDSTIVFIKQTKDALYFGFRWWPKGKIISKSFIRDQSTAEENEFFIILDMENKNENGYFFAFSFLNNQRDALIYNKRYSSFEWDWVWYCKSTIYKEAKDGNPGYVESEVKIPVAKMPNKNDKQIGIDLQLFAYKPDGSGYFYSITPNSEISTVKGTYKLDLVTPFENKLSLSFNVQPFVVGDKFNGSNYHGTLGGDGNISYINHKLKLTYNTDQSTLEADPYRFSFYNRPIYLQEKRPFLSKDLDIYSTPMNLFYTRAIDSIKYGANYTYRSDKFRLGTIYLEEPKDSSGNRVKYFVARPYFNFSNMSFGSLILMNRDYTNNYRENILSFDGLFRLPGTRFLFSTQGAGNIGKNEKGYLYRFYSYYESNNAGGPFYDLYYDRVDKNFHATTAFNSNVGAQNDYDEFNFVPGYQWSFNRPYFYMINVNGGYYLNRQVSTNFYYQDRWNANIFYQINEMFNISHYFEYNRPNDYDASGNLIRRTNFLQEHDLKILLGRSAIYLGYFFGTYFGSYVKNPYMNFDVVLFDKVTLKFSYNYRTLFDIKQSIYSVRMDARLLDKLYLRSYFQQDTYNKQALWNSLLQYEFFAGSNVYLVFNLLGDRLHNTGRFFKVGYEFNF